MENPPVAPVPAETPVPLETSSPAAPAAPAALVSADSLAAENMVPAMAASAAPVVPPANAPVSKAALDYKGKRNKHGEIFDPAVHKSNANGKPFYDSRGHYRRLAIGRPRKPDGELKAPRRTPVEPLAAPDTPPASVFSTPPAPTFNDGTGAVAGPLVAPMAVGPDKYDAAAEGFCKLGDALMIKFFSEEIANTKDEHTALKTALAPALRESDIGDMPPWIAFSMVSLAVYLPKFEKPTVKQRAAVLYLKVRGFFTRLVGRIFDRGVGRPPVAKAQRRADAEADAEGEGAPSVESGDEMP